MTTDTASRISANKLLMDICNFDKSLFDASTLSPDEVKYYNSITRGFDKQIQFFIGWLDSDEARRIFYENESYNEEVFSEIEDEIKSIVGDTSLTADEIISHIYDSGLEAGADEIRRTKYYNDATKFGLYFLQDYNFELIKNVNTDLANHIRAEIFTGIAAGEGMPEVAKRILTATGNSLTGKTLSAKQRAMMIARTETARAMTQGRLQSYVNYGVREVKVLTAGDESVCAICREAADKIFPISEAGNLVPFHPLCRCSVMAYIRHGILQGYPDSDADSILCLDNATQNNVRFNRTITDKPLSNDVISAEEEFNEIYKKSSITIKQFDGSEKTYYIECSEKIKVDFPKDKDMGDGELCYEYKIFDDKKKLLVTFYRSEEGTNVSFTQALEVYGWLPDKLKKNCKEIVLSNQGSGKSAGYVHPEHPTRINILNLTDFKNIDDILTHEMAHCFDITNGYISNGEYAEALSKDLDNLLEYYNYSEITIDLFPYPDAYYNYINPENFGHEGAPCAEDFAYTVSWFLRNGGQIKSPYIEKTKYLKELLL